MSAGGSGVNAYWPGFVDALTNVVIAMIFVVVALAISLTFAAQLMGKKLAERLVQEHVAKAAAVASKLPDGKTPPPDGDASSLSSRTVIDVKSIASAASAPVRVRTGSSLLQLNYAPGAVTLDPEAVKRLREAVKPQSATIGTLRVELVGMGPTMSSSDNQRAAYTRLMALRNELLDLGFRPESIQLRIDTEREAPQPMVRMVIKE